MKLLQKIVLLALFSTYLFGSEHCIQVAGVNKFDPQHIRPVYKEILDNYDKARIDKRGHRLVLRVGSYPNASSARADLRKIKHKFRDAYIRRCNYDPLSAVYPPYNSIKSQNRVVEDVEPELTTFEDDQPVEVKQASARKTQKVEDTGTKPFSYRKQSKYEYQFMKECQKCFAPISDEATGNYHDVKEGVSEDMLEEEDMQDDGIEVTESSHLVSSKKSLKRKKDATQEESSSWLGSIFGIFSSDDEQEADDENNIDIDIDDYNELNDAETTKDGSIFVEDQANIKEPVKKDTEVQESTSYYAD